MPTGPVSLSPSPCICTAVNDAGTRTECRTALSVQELGRRSASDAWRTSSSPRPARRAGGRDRYWELAAGCEPDPGAGRCSRPASPTTVQERDLRREGPRCGGRAAALGSVEGAATRGRGAAGGASTCGEGVAGAQLEGRRRMAWPAGRRVRSSWCELRWERGDEDWERSLVSGKTD
ncbi:hypothetical protein PAHAL_2G343200 [Panicum hallii]|uniref:Uncharacterized protein n=1 Tax=Panicum hallii TaxID=206008 RepID=A0A2T8KRA8_9POAL|nr:hypothetical protein PAHAL_2G343200 [Panicum hallii]